MRNARQRVLLATLALVVGMLAPTMGSPTSPAAAADDAVEAAGSKTVGSLISSAEQGVSVAAVRRWTPEDMLAAEPLPPPSGAFERELTSPGPATPRGRPGTAPGTPPLSARSIGPLDVAGAETGGGLTALARRGPTGWTGFEVAAGDYKKPPYRVAGRLFFTRDGKKYHCTATSVGNRTVGAIWTAGHCVHAGNNSASGWHKDAVFVPGYRFDKSKDKKPVEPYGQWKVTSLTTTSVWFQSGGSKVNPAWALDLGGGLAVNQVRTVGGRALTRTLTDEVGSVGVAWNQDYEQFYTSLGYPGEPVSLFDGHRMHGCQSNLVFKLDWKEIDPDTSYDPSPGMGCDMQGGSSGGPWLKKFSSAPTLVGLNSWSPKNAIDESIDRNVMFTPYFGSIAKELYEYLLCINGATRCAPRTR